MSIDSRASAGGAPAPQPPAARTAVAPLPLEQVDCPLCGAASAVHVASSRDVAMGVPGVFSLARCARCGLLHQNPRVRVDHLDRAYPPNYGPHARDPELPRILTSRGRAVRFVLHERLGYGHVDVSDVGWRDRLAGRWRRRKIVTAFPPWHGQGRLLDVGCASGKFLGQMRAMGWSVAGVEFDPEAALKAKTITPDVFVGDPVDAPFAPASFDLITAFHVIEHLPFPREALGRMLGWLAPGGLIVVEVPNVGGVGGRLFGRYWSGLDFPRHLVHFTPSTMDQMVARAGGRVVDAVHRTKPRYLTRSIKHWLSGRESGAARLGLTLLQSPPVRGGLKAVLEVTMPLGRALGYGEAVRYFIRRKDDG